MSLRRIFTKIPSVDNFRSSRLSKIVHKSVLEGEHCNKSILYNAMRPISSTPKRFEVEGSNPVKTFATENPELVKTEPGKVPDHEKVYFEDFEPGEPIELVPLPPFDDGSGRVVASPELHKLADRILCLSLLEIHQLTLLFNDHFNFDSTDMASLMSGVGGGQTSAASEEEAVVEEKTVFDIKLTGFDAKAKIKVIKEIRSAAGLGLKEAKELVEGAPKIVKKDMKKEDAEALKEKLESLGATVEIV